MRDREVKRYRSVFISDIHLGALGCKVEAVQQFLHSFECETLYLVGDIIDGWVGSRASKWTQANTNLVRTILGKSKRGALVRYTPGNHDAFLHRMNGQEMGQIHIDHEFEHRTLDGRRLWVVHGDLFDTTVTKYRLLAYTGAWIYEYAFAVNNRVNRSRSRRDRRPIDFTTGLKKATKRIVKSTTSFETKVMAQARESGYNGVVCGHTHRPSLEAQPDGFLWVNTGDWVEHCTAVVETLEGELSLVWWNPIAGAALPRPTAAAKPGMPMTLL